MCARINCIVRAFQMPYIFALILIQSHFYYFGLAQKRIYDGIRKSSLTMQKSPL
jgi:hypothetical protein